MAISLMVINIIVARISGNLKIVDQKIYDLVNNEFIVGNKKYVISDSNVIEYTYNEKGQIETVKTGNQNLYIEYYFEYNSCF